MSEPAGWWLSPQQRRVMCAWLAAHGIDANRIPYAAPPGLAIEVGDGCTRIRYRYMTDPIEWDGDSLALEPWQEVILPRETPPFEYSDH